MDRKLNIPIDISLQFVAETIIAFLECGINEKNRDQTLSKLRDSLRHMGKVAALKSGGFYALEEIIEITSKGDRLPESLEIEEIAESALGLLADDKGELE